MREKFKDNIFRVVYSLVCLGLCVASFCLQKFISESQEAMLAFSYYASVATLIALIIAVMEIIYAIRINKSSQEKMRERVEWFKGQTVSHLSHVCSSYYESSLDDLANNQYAQLSLNFRVALKLHRNIANNFVSKSDRELFESKHEIINKLDVNIQDARYTPPQDKLPSRKAKEIRESILEIKSIIDSKHIFTNQEV